jgi:hypothetical protein
LVVSWLVEVAEELHNPSLFLLANIQSVNQFTAALHFCCSCRHHKESERRLFPAALDAGSSSSTSGCVDAGSRAVVVSWLVEVGEEFALQQESLHAAVGLLDRFLASAAVSLCFCERIL